MKTSVIHQMLDAMLTKTVAIILATLVVLYLPILILFFIVAYLSILLMHDLPTKAEVFYPE